MLLISLHDKQITKEHRSFFMLRVLPQLFITTLLFFASVEIAAGETSDIQTVKLTILTFNDIYEINAQNGYQGVAGLKTILDIERNCSERYITTVNGDFLAPSLYASLFKGKHMIDLFNLLEIDVVTFGNHEFDFGTNILADRMQESNFAWLGTNVLDTHTGLPFHHAESTMLFQIGDIKFGMIGLTTTETAELSNPPRGIIFAPIIISAQAAVHRLKKSGADVVIALTHMNMSEDIQLAKNVPEIDVILGGHDHEPMTLLEGNTLIHKSGMDGKFLGRIDLQVEKRTLGDRTRTHIYPTVKLVPNHGTAKDAAIEKKLNEFKEFIDLQMGMKIGVLMSPMTSVGVRKGENSFANLVADAVRDAYEADIGIINAGAIRGEREYPEGFSLSRTDMQKEMPFGNIAVLVELSGENLVRGIEYALSKIEEQSGCFLHFSGLKLVYDPKAAPGNRVREILIKNRPLDKNALYRIATLDYLSKGGDGNLSFANGKSIIGSGTGRLMIDILCEYISMQEIIIPQIQGRIIEIGDAKEIKAINSGDNKRIQLRP